MMKLKKSRRWKKMKESQMIQNTAISANDWIDWDAKNTYKLELEWEWASG